MQEGLEKESRRLLDHREEAIAFLDKALREHILKAYHEKAKKRNGILKSIDLPA